MSDDEPVLNRAFDVRFYPDGSWGGKSEDLDLFLVWVDRYIRGIDE